MNVMFLPVNPGWADCSTAALTVFRTDTLSANACRGQLDAAEDGVCLAVCRRTGMVELFRSIATSDQLYYYADGNRLVVSDHFAAVLSSVPLRDRHVDERAVIDHFLFRTTPGTGTYVSAVRRVGNGELVRFAPGSEVPHVTVRQKVQRREALTELEAARVLERELERVALPEDGDIFNLLTGGVDSTLLHTFVSARAQPVSADIDSPEFSLERDYAAAASALFAQEHRWVRMKEDDYADCLVDVIRRGGLPPHHLQTVLVDAAISFRQGSYLTAQFADALFGLDASYRVWRIRKYRALHYPGVLRTAGRLPWGRIRRAAIAVYDDVSRLRLDPDDPDGFGMRFATYADVPAAVQIFGADAVRDRFITRREYVERRLDPFSASDDRSIQHLELGHWLDFFCDDTISVWRQCAHSRGRRLIAPFSTRSVVELALAIPATLRFCIGGRTKPVLKRLLKQRLPDYQVDKQKGGSGLPVTRYLSDGPLREFAASARAADWPITLPGELAASPPWMLWNQLTFRLWDEAVRTSVQPPSKQQKVVNIAVRGEAV